jgi:threonine synthase
MRYLSTRGGMTPQLFTDVLLEGLAPDGGLAVPETIPQVTADQLRAWRKLSYADLAFEVLRLFITDLPEDDLRALTRATYRPEVFGGDVIVPLKPLNRGLSLLGLSEGPTLAFKDMAMQFLGNLFEYVLAKRGTTLNILGATSGDTGSAAEYAMRGKKGVAVFMLSPAGRMSEFQRAQMYSLQDDNIHNIAVHGVFDDCQDIVKEVSADLDFKARHHIGAVNSINWARIAAQVVYYFHGWRLATEGMNDAGALPQVSFAVPSGNFGNILAGHIARSMGLPIRHLVLATNENNVLEEFFRTGIYRPRASSETYETSSPSMDISKASNFERFVYDLMGRDPARLKALWDELAAKGSFDLSVHKPRFAEYGFVSGTSSHADRLATIRTVHAETGVVIDPHTADGVKVAWSFVEDGIPMLVLETALPVKFGATIEESLGFPAPRPDGFDGIEQLPQRVQTVKADVQTVKDIVAADAV